MARNKKVSTYMVETFLFLAYLFLLLLEYPIIYDGTNFIAVLLSLLLPIVARLAATRFLAQLR